MSTIPERHEAPVAQNMLEMILRYELPVIYQNMLLILASEKDTAEPGYIEFDEGMLLHKAAKNIEYPTDFSAAIWPYLEELITKVRATDNPAEIAALKDEVKPKFEELEVFEVKGLDGVVEKADPEEGLTTLIRIFKELSPAEFELLKETNGVGKRNAEDEITVPNVAKTAALAYKMGKARFGRFANLFELLKEYDEAHKELGEALNEGGRGAKTVIKMRATKDKLDELMELTGPLLEEMDYLTKTTTVEERVNDKVVTVEVKLLDIKDNIEPQDLEELKDIMLRIRDGYEAVKSGISQHKAKAQTNFGEIIKKLPAHKAIVKVMDSVDQMTVDFGANNDKGSKNAGKVIDLIDRYTELKKVKTFRDADEELAHKAAIAETFTELQVGAKMIKTYYEKMAVSAIGYSDEIKKLAEEAEKDVSLQKARTNVTNFFKAAQSWVTGMAKGYRDYGVMPVQAGVELIIAKGKGVEAMPENEKVPLQEKVEKLDKMMDGVDRTYYLVQLIHLKAGILSEAMGRGLERT